MAGSSRRSTLAWNVRRGGMLALAVHAANRREPQVPELLPFMGRTWTQRHTQTHGQTHTYVGKKAARSRWGSGDFRLISFLPACSTYQGRKRIKQRNYKSLYY